MQDSLTNPPHWLQLALTAVVSLIAREGIVKSYHTWLNRKKPAAETTEITVRTYSQAGDAMGRMMDRLDAAQVTIDGVRADNIRLEKENELLKMRLDLMAIAEQSMKDQLDSAVAYIKFLGKHPTDVDRFRVQVKEERQKYSELDTPRE